MMERLTADDRKPLMMRLFRGGNTGVHRGFHADLSLLADHVSEKSLDFGLI
jgi:hypothetical protein